MMARLKHIALLDKTAELTRLLKASTDLKVFLTDLSTLIAKHMEADSCLFFIYDKDQDELVLQGTYGLSSGFVGKLRLKSGEGITGTVLKTLRPINAGHADKHPKFKPVHGIGEESFHSLLSVPIRRGMHRIGVITLYKREPCYFTLKDVTVLIAIASQIASSVLSAGILLSLKHKASPSVTIDSPVHGIGASPGIVHGETLLFDRQQFSYPEDIQQDSTEEDFGEADTVEEFDGAIEKTLGQLKQIEDDLGVGLSDIAGLIFTAHYLMLKDPNYTGVMRSHIEGGMSIEHAIRSVTSEYAAMFAATDNPRIQEKEQDLRDLEHRLLTNLHHTDTDRSDYSAYVIVASAIYPSELVRFWVQKAKGIILHGQGLTAHISILSRSLNLPLLLVNNREILHIPNSTPVIMDATQGILHVNPEVSLIKQYEKIARKEHPPIPKDLTEKNVTMDGRTIEVQVNVNILHDAECGFKQKAGGIGLYRSEFPFLIQNDFPSEMQQLQVYSKICDSSGDHEITLRTLDIGGDKLPGYVENISEDNPFLGLRGIRYSLETPDIFHEQIRAMLRAGAGRQLRLLFPMVSSLEEFLSAKQAVYTCMKSLEDQGVEYCRNPKMGAMVEVPSAVEIAADLAEEADFLSIGTNDLIMYLLAVDRGNERIGEMHTAYHPAVMRTLKRFVENVRSTHPDIAGYLSVCGDAAGDPLFLPYLIGIGISSFSVEPAKLVSIKQLISKLSYEKCTMYAHDLLQARTTGEVERKISKSFVCSMSQ